LLREKCSVSKSLTVYTIEKIRKTFLSRNLRLNMPKNVIFIKKIVKIAEI